jgi:S-adenosylmethionine hydrolase
MAYQPTLMHKNIIYLIWLLISVVFFNPSFGESTADTSRIQYRVKTSAVPIYIDNFSNVITNITKDLFTRIQKNREFTLYFKKNEKISQLSWHYNEVPEGEKLCIFGISNHLEIAMNKGKASGLLGLHLGDIVRVEFHN